MRDEIVAEIGRGDFNDPNYLQSYMETKKRLLREQFHFECRDPKKLRPQIHFKKEDDRH